jgi:hypothetical protein
VLRTEITRSEDCASRWLAGNEELTSTW